MHAMREAARSFVGFHDFRNFCKVDPTKQITNFHRRIFYADIIPVDPNRGLLGYVDLLDDGPPSSIPAPPAVDGGGADAGAGAGTGAGAGAGAGVTGLDLTPSYALPPRTWAFVVHGSGFLWHQVRHMMAILFLVGQGLEPPSVVAELLDATKNPCKPAYTMAGEAPLVLWDCIFPRADTDADDADKDDGDALEWVYAADEDTRSRSDGVCARPTSSLFGRTRYDPGRLWEQLWSTWRARKMDEILAGSLFEVLAGTERRRYRQQHQRQRQHRRDGDRSHDEIHEPTTVKEGRRQLPQTPVYFDGGDAPRKMGKYIPVLSLPRNKPVEETNARWAARKGFQRRLTGAGKTDDNG